jgi:CheY-like chemotaxis protein
MPTMWIQLPSAHVADRVMFTQFGYCLPFQDTVRCHTIAAAAIFSCTRTYARAFSCSWAETGSTTKALNLVALGTNGFHSVNRICRFGISNEHDLEPRTIQQPLRRGSSALCREPALAVQPITPSASLAGCSILICKDEPLTALEIADAFSNAGARVLTVRSCSHALIAVEDEVPSAVILDHALTDGESSRLGEYLKERNIPYVLHSGYGAEDHDGAGVTVAYVPKPASPQHIVTTVEGLLLSRQITKPSARCGPLTGVC